MTNEDIQRIKKLIEKCDDCKLNECTNCGISWSEVSTIRRLLDAYIEISKENEKLKNKDTNKVSLEIGKSKTIKKIYVSDKQIGLGILTNWTGRKLDFLFANKINELVQAVNQLSKKTEE